MGPWNSNPYKPPPGGKQKYHSSKKAQGWPADPGYDMGMDRNPGWVIKLVEVKGKAEWRLSQVKQPSAFGSSKKKD